MPFHMHRTDVWTSRPLTADERREVHSLIHELLAGGDSRTLLVVDLGVEHDFENFLPTTFQKLKEASVS